MKVKQLIQDYLPLISAQHADIGTSIRTMLLADLSDEAIIEYIENVVTLNSQQTALIHYLNRIIVDGTVLIESSHRNTRQLETEEQLDSSNDEEPSNPAGLLSLSDELLIHIALDLSIEDAISLSMVCEKLKACMHSNIYKIRFIQKSLNNPSYNITIPCPPHLDPNSNDAEQFNAFVLNRRYRHCGTTIEDTLPRDPNIQIPHFTDDEPLPHRLYWAIRLGKTNVALDLIDQLDDIETIILPTARVFQTAFGVALSFERLDIMLYLLGKGASVREIFHLRGRTVRPLEFSEIELSWMPIFLIYRQNEAKALFEILTFERKKECFLSLMTAAKELPLLYDIILPLAISNPSPYERNLFDHVNFNLENRKYAPPLSLRKAIFNKLVDLLKSRGSYSHEKAETLLELMYLFPYKNINNDEALLEELLQCEDLYQLFPDFVTRIFEYSLIFDFEKSVEAILSRGVIQLEESYLYELIYSEYRRANLISGKIREDYPTLKECNTALTMAIYCKSIRSLAVLIRHGANIHRSLSSSGPYYLNRLLGNPLTMAIELYNSNAAVLLLKSGANPEGCDRLTRYYYYARAALARDGTFSRRDFYTPLSRACFNNMPSVVRALLDHGASCSDSEKNNYFMEAYNNNSLELFNVLLHAGVDSKKANLPHRFITKYNQKEYRAYIIALFAPSEPLSLADALLLAIEQEDVTKVKTLLAGKINVKINLHQSGKGVYMSHKIGFDRCVNSGSDVMDNAFMFMFAATKGNLSIFKLLHEHLKEVPFESYASFWERFQPKADVLTIALYNKHFAIAHFLTTLGHQPDTGNAQLESKFRQYVRTQEFISNGSVVQLGILSQGGRVSRASSSAVAIEVASPAIARRKTI